MTPLLGALFVLSIGCDVAGQIFFKVGAMSVPVKDGVRPGKNGVGPGKSDAAVGFANWQSEAAVVVRNKWLLAGIATYALEALVWLRILSEVPISVAFPIASLNFLGVALASRWFLGEVVTRRQWAGAGLVTMGVALVARVS